MLIDLDCTIVSFWEGLVMIGRVYVRLVIVFGSCKTEINNELLGSSYSEIWMYEGYLFGRHTILLYATSSYTIQS